MLGHMELEGGRELARALKRLDDDLARRVIVNANQRAIKIMAVDAKSRAPKGETGLLERAIRVYKDRRKSGRGYVAHRLHVSQKIKNPDRNNWPAFYWYYLEFGTAKMRRRSFLRPAFYSKRKASIAEMFKTLRRRIAQA